MNQLLDLRDKLVDQVKILSDSSLKNVRGAGEELADIASDNFIRETELNLMSEEGRKIQLIQEAIVRLEANAYGVCVDCDKAIQEARLKAIPYAKLCIGCKTIRENPNLKVEQEELTE